ncbi:hypothetical protein FPOAC2_14081 [Fusarium poae]
MSFGGTFFILPGERGVVDGNFWTGHVLSSLYDRRIGLSMSHPSCSIFNLNSISCISCIERAVAVAVISNVPVSRIMPSCYHLSAYITCTPFFKKPPNQSHYTTQWDDRHQDNVVPGTLRDQLSVQGV